MQGLIANFAALGRRRLAILGGVGIAIVALLMLGLNAVRAPEMVPLYRNLSLTAAGTIENSLAGAGFRVQVSDDGTSLSVPRTDMARARMVVAETGVPIDGDPGWEIFDESSGLAMNSFMQKINRLRAMEGELARSIQTLEGVQSARVHLVLPEREPFARETPVPRASIVVRAATGRTISRKQAVAIRNLVSSAVAGLDLGMVTVLSATGETILAEGNEGGGAATIASSKAGIEDRLASEIQSLLTARVGAGNARVHVNVDLTTAREVIVEHSFNPDQQVVRSTENSTENQKGSEGGGNVGVENNIPAPLGGPGNGATTQRSESGETVRYEIGNTRREVVREAGDVKRVSVAVLVNGIYSVDGSDVTYSERSPEELTRLTELVRSAVGYDAGRGDTISVDSMRFMDYSMDVGDPITLSMTEQVTQNIVPILRGLLALGLVALVLIFGVRPALRQFAELRAETDAVDADEDFEQPQIAADAAPEALPGQAARAALPGAAGAQSAAGQAAAGTQVAAADGTGMAGIYDVESDTGDYEYIETMGVRGNLIKARVEAIRSMADDKPDEVLRVLRGWLAQEAEA